MKPQDIQAFLAQHEKNRTRTIAIIDFGNVEKWKHSLEWRIGIRELARLVKHFSTGKRFLRRFYGD